MFSFNERTMDNEGTVALNNYLQSKNQAALLTWEESSSGPAHAPQWTLTCKLNGEVVGVGTGAQKHIAKDMAAKAALQTLNPAT